MPYVTIPLACIFISFIIGYLGRNKKMGFWGYFFATLLLTPFIGALLLIISDKRKPDADTNSENKN